MARGGAGFRSLRTRPLPEPAACSFFAFLLLRSPRFARDDIFLSVILGLRCTLYRAAPNRLNWPYAGQASTLPSWGPARPGSPRRSAPPDAGRRWPSSSACPGSARRSWRPAAADATSERPPLGFGLTTSTSRPSFPSIKPVRRGGDPGLFRRPRSPSPDG